MKYKQWIIIQMLFVVFSVSSCKPTISGGGITHLPQKSLIAGKDSKFVLELSVWGSGNAEKDWSDVNCVIHDDRIRKQKTFPMRQVGVKKNKVIYEVTVPKEAIGTLVLHYHFTGKLNGHQNKTLEYEVPIK